MMRKYCDKCQIEEPTMRAIYHEPSPSSSYRLDEWVQYLCDDCYDGITIRVQEGYVFDLIGHELTQ
jgi:hypothetical protein